MKLAKHVSRRKERINAYEVKSVFYKDDHAGEGYRDVQGDGQGIDGKGGGQGTFG